MDVEFWEIDPEEEYISTAGFYPGEALVFGIASVKSDYAHVDDIYFTPGGAKLDVGR